MPRGANFLHSAGGRCAPCAGAAGAHLVRVRVRVRVRVTVRVTVRVRVSSWCARPVTGESATRAYLCEG